MSEKFNNYMLAMVREEAAYRNVMMGEGDIDALVREHMIALQEREEAFGEWFETLS